MKPLLKALLTVVRVIGHMTAPRQEFLPETPLEESSLWLLGHSLWNASSHWDDFVNHEKADQAMDAILKELSRRDIELAGKGEGEQLIVLHEEEVRELKKELMALRWMLKRRESQIASFWTDNPRQWWGWGGCSGPYGSLLRNLKGRGDD